MFAWYVFLHLVGIVLFFAAHGVSMAVSFLLRRQTERTAVASLLGLSQAAVRISYLGLLLLGIGGLGAAATAGWLTATWVVWSYVVLVVIFLAMFAIGAPYYYGLRDALNGTKKAPPVEDAELIGRLVSRRPDVLAAVGGFGTIVLVWLMVLKPG